MGEDDENINMDVDNNCDEIDDIDDFISENSLNVRLSLNTIGKLEPCQEDDIPKMVKMVSFY